MKVTIKGLGEETLTDKNFVAKGGEATIYQKGGRGFKIYHDPTKMIPIGKFQELSVLDRPEIIRPERLVLNSRNEVIGYTMRFVEANPLCQLFTKAYRKRNNITPELMVELVKKFRALIQFIHSKKILVVDLNELNFLISKGHDQLYAIDVNSYQTPSFPAPALMPSVRDWHCKNNHWTEGTDWFSWAIVTCWMLIGIHPYRGGHPKYDHLPSEEQLEARMKANVSIFNKDATMPGVCQPLAVIPEALKQWYMAVLDKGQRIAPPDNFEKVAPVVLAPLAALVGKLFQIEELASYGEEVVAHYFSVDTRVVVTTQAAYVQKRKYPLPTPNCVVGFTPKANKPVAAYIQNHMLRLVEIESGTTLPITAAATDIISSGDRINFVCGNLVSEVQFAEIGNRILPTVRPVGNILDVPGATKVFDGCVIQNLLGKWYASVFPSAGKCIQIKLDQLDGYKLVDAKYERGVLGVIGTRSGKYDRFLFRLDKHYAIGSVMRKDNVIYSGLNFTVGDQGAVVFINEEEKVEIFSTNPTATAVQTFSDPAVDGDVTLTHEGAKIMFYKKNKLYWMTTKK